MTASPPGQFLAVEVRGLVKRYGETVAVRGVDLAIARGEIFALLGPNGAGKTTIIEILEGFRRRDEGTVLVLGQDPASHRATLTSRVGIVLQSTAAEPFLTVTEAVSMWAGWYPDALPVAEVIDMVGLGAKRGSRVARLSGGEQRRLDVAIALCGDPEVLFLDEPTTGFDPSARREAWDLVKSLAGLGKTIMLTTHYMDEAQHLAGRVAVLAAGRIVAEGPPATLGGRDLALATIRYRLPPGVAPPAGLCDRFLADGTIEHVPGDLTSALHQLTGWSVDNGIDLMGLEVSRPTLEDIYLSLTGERR